MPKMLRSLPLNTDSPDMIVKSDILMHHSFVSTAPAYQDSDGIAGYGAVQVLFDCHHSAEEVQG